MVVSGTVFSRAVVLGPFVETLPTSGKVGAIVRFNGTAAAFTIVSSSYIKTSVPSGTTMGSVTVTTSTGILTSNVSFEVTK